MKLFQIEEPDGSPTDAAEGSGAAVGIDIAPGGIGRVAIAVGGNGEILPDADGERTLRARDRTDLLLGLRSRAEKQLGRPVTHAVIAADSAERIGLEAAATQAGLTLLRVVDRPVAAALATGAAAEEAAVLGAAISAEEMAPDQSSMGPT
jgi:Hsp70 protein